MDSNRTIDANRTRLMSNFSGRFFNDFLASNAPTATSVAADIVAILSLTTTQGNPSFYGWFQNNIQTPDTAQQSRIQWTGSVPPVSLALNLNVISPNFAVAGSNEIRVRMGDTLSAPTFTPLASAANLATDAPSLRMPPNTTFCVLITNNLLGNVSLQAANFYSQAGMLINQQNSAILAPNLTQPFNRWEFWELALYQPMLLPYLKNQTFKPTDNFQFICSYLNLTISSTNSNPIQNGIAATVSFTCGLQVNSTIDSKAYFPLQNLTFTQNLVLNFTVNPGPSSTMNFING